MRANLPQIVIPVAGLDPIVFDLEVPRARTSSFTREMEAQALEDAGISRAAQMYMGFQAAGAFDYLENKLLDHALGKAAFTMPSPVYLALCTVVPEDSKTGATITEANYTGYARKKIEAAQLTSAASGKSKNNTKLEFAECTAGSSTVVGWAILDAAGTGAGNGLFWGTCTSTAISVTQTPANIPSEQLVVEAD